VSTRKKRRKKTRASGSSSAKHSHVHAHDGHSHEHEHEGHAHHQHEHEHSHVHVHAHAPRSRPDLPAGCGKGKILFFDAPSGLAGDMIIAALVDLGVPEKVIEDAVAKLPFTGFHLHFGSRVKSGIVGTAFDVHVDEKQPERTYGEIRVMLEKSKLAPGIKSRALSTFRHLAESEAKVHRMPLEEVHFHEVGAVDAIVDVVGSAAALEHLGAHVVVSPLPMGHGRIKARHGILPLPPPAVVECLRGFPTYDAKIAFELVTPTGAAIVASHARGDEATRWPSMRVEHAGWGAGTKDLADRPNLLRAVLGVETSPELGKAKANGEEAAFVILEANVDDATGELLGSCIETLLSAGALDAWAVPLTMKKGRPAYLLGALGSKHRADELSRLILRESTTLGVRRYPVDRLERPRRIEHVETRFGTLPIKVADGPFGPPQRKPEFDACSAAAREYGVPVREVLEAVLVAAVAGTKNEPGNPPKKDSAKKRREKRTGA
jgi:pyridinium-3,5-bisthiocarboxylic acid mononucleotide nickel chelatase